MYGHFFSPLNLMQVRVWLLSIGHSLGFGTVIAKLLRIYYIFKYNTLVTRWQQFICSSSLVTQSW